MVSVIIPVYQVSDYIERCIRSVMRQSYADIECIIVDDATRDDSILKCEELIGAYKGAIRFRMLHHKENRGLSAARNTGTAAATGDYLYYLDSDDEMTPDCMEKLVAISASHPEAEMVMGNHQEYRRDGSVNVFMKPGVPSGILAKMEFAPLFQQVILPVGAWNKLIKRSFVEAHQLYFREGIIYEDYLWMFFVIKVMTKVFILEEVTYKYYIRPGSIMTASDDHTIGTSYCVIYDEILHNLTSGYEKVEISRYVYGFCKRYLKFRGDIPKYEDLYTFYRKQAKRFVCVGANAVLRLVHALGHLDNPLCLLEPLNKIRWKIKRLFLKKYHYAKQTHLPLSGPHE